MNSVKCKVHTMHTKVWLYTLIHMNQLPVIHSNESSDRLAVGLQAISCRIYLDKRLWQVLSVLSMHSVPSMSTKHPAIRRPKFVAKL